MYNNFTFEYPYFLFLIVLFIICSIYCKAKTPTYLIPHLNIFKFANQKSMIFINSLKYLVIIFSILALASPVKINDTILLKNDGVNILLNLDASGSMKERDLDENYSKNRFEVVKDIVKDFMDKKGAFLCWYFMYVPIGRNPNFEMMLTPEQRKEFFDKISYYRRVKPIILADF